MKTISRDDIVTIIKTMDVDNLPDNLIYDKPLREQGLDSLDMMSVYFAIEEQLGITLTDETLASGIWKTIDDFVKNINIIIEKK